MRGRARRLNGAAFTAKVASVAVNREKTPPIFYRPAGQRVSPSMTLPPRT